MAYLQIDHKFNESLTIMHLVHVYGPCANKRRSLEFKHHFLAHKYLLMVHWEGGYEVINQLLRTANGSGQLWGGALSGTTRCCAATGACWDAFMCLCAAYLKPRHAAGHKSDVDPAVIRTVIYSVRFEFHLSTNTHVLFLAFRWGAPCQPALQHSLCLWLYGSWSARSIGNCTTYKDRGGGDHHYTVCTKDWSLTDISDQRSPCWVLHKNVVFLFTWGRDGHENPKKPFNERWQEGSFFSFPARDIKVKHRIQ